MENFTREAAKIIYTTFATDCTLHLHGAGNDTHQSNGAVRELPYDRISLAKGQDTVNRY